MPKKFDFGTKLVYCIGIVKLNKKEKIMTITQLENRLAKLKTDLAWWVAKLATSRSANKIGERSAQVSWHRQEIGNVKRELFARHCDEQV